MLSAKNLGGWDQWIQEHAGDGGLLQSSGWAEFQRALGRRVEQIDCRMQNAECRILVVEHPLPFGQSYVYSPRGPVVNYRHREPAEAGEAIHNHAVDCFPSPPRLQRAGVALQLLAMTELVKTKFPKAIFWRIEPTTEFRIQNSEFRIVRAPRDIQPATTLVIDLTKSEDELLAQMKQKTRYNVRTAIRHGVAVRRMQNSECRMQNLFLDLLEETAKRDRFRTHPRGYYEKLLTGTSHCEPQRSNPETIDAVDCHGPTKAGPRNDNDREQRTYTLEPRFELFAAFHGGTLLAGAIVAIFGKWAYYLHGASSSNNRELMAPYLLHWEIMRQAKQRGCTKYDLWGVSSVISKQRTVSSWVGITKFKTGFAPALPLTHYPGTFDVALKPLLYHLYRLARRGYRV